MATHFECAPPISHDKDNVISVFRPPIRALLSGLFLKVAGNLFMLLCVWLRTLNLRHQSRVTCIPPSAPHMVSPPTYRLEEPETVFLCFQSRATLIFAVVHVYRVVFCVFNFTRYRLGGYDVLFFPVIRP